MRGTAMPGSKIAILMRWLLMANEIAARTVAYRDGEDQAAASDIEQFWFSIDFIQAPRSVEGNDDICVVLVPHDFELAIVEERLQRERRSAHV